MKKYFIIAIICIISYGCEVAERKDSSKIVAIVEGTTILEKQIDSIISPQLYQLKKNSLKYILRSTIIEYQAKMHNLTKDEYIKKYFNSNNKVTYNQYNKYLMDQNVNPKNIDTSMIVNYLYMINKQTNLDHFADSLLAKSEIRINLKPDHLTEVKTNELYSHDLSFGKKLIVYIISDYNCHACQNAENRLRKIINKYEKLVNFRFVYFSEYIDRKALVAEAAASQGKFVEMHDFLFDHPTIKAGDQSLLEFADGIGLDMELFEENIFNPSTLKHLMINKERIIKQNIYVTPSFIINNKLINDEFALYTLENLINEELEKEK